MKSMVFTVIAVVLMATLCLMAVDIGKVVDAQQVCVDLVGDGAQPIKHVRTSFVWVLNDYDTIVHADTRDGVVYLALIGGSQPIPNACGLTPKNPSAEWTGWGGPLDTDNATVGEGPGSRNKIVTGGYYFERGLGSHAVGTLVYDLSGDTYTRFEGWIGLSDEKDPRDEFCGDDRGSGTFAFLLDGSEVYRSSTLPGVTSRGEWNSPAVEVAFDIPSTARELTIVMGDGGDGNHCDHSVIGDAKLLTSRVTGDGPEPVKVSEAHIIPNAELAKVIREALGLGAGAPITVAAMRELTEFSARGQEIADLTGLEHATQLEKLSLGGTGVYDISPLAALTQLTVLDLGGIRVSVVSDLAALTQLTELDLGGTGVYDISPLANLTQLTVLDLNETNVEDISPLVALTQLKELNLEGCPLSPASHTHVLALRQRGVTVNAPAPPPPPVWVLEDSWRGPRGDQLQHVEKIAFAGNNLVFWASGDRLYKWDFEANRAWWQDFNGRRVIGVAIPRNNPSVVAYGLRNNNGEEDWVSLRKTADLSWVTSTRQEGVKSLSADEDGFHLAVLGFWNYYTYDIWGASGWQFDAVDWAGTSATGAIALDNSDQVFGSRFVLTFYTRGGGNSISVSEYYDGADRYLPGISVAGKAFTNGPLAFRKGKDAGQDGLIAVASDASIYFFVPKSSTTYTVKSIANRDGEGHTRRAPITCLALGGDYYATSTAHDDFVCFWDLSTGVLAQKLDVGFQWAEIAFSQDNSYMAVANGPISGGDRSIKIYRWSGDDPGSLAAPAQKTESSQPTALLANYPNPFNPETWIPYQLAEPAEVSVSIYSVDGKLVRTLELGQVPAGTYQSRSRAAYWDGRNAQGESVASGVYFYTLQAGDFSATRKMVIRK